MLGSAFRCHCSFHYAQMFLLSLLTSPDAVDALSSEYAALIEYATGRELIQG